MSSALASFIAFVAGAVVLVLLPGPDTLVVMRSVLRGGRHGGIRASAGVLCGLMVWIAVSVLGLSAMLHASHIGYEILRIVGACYLIWIGLQSVRSLLREIPASTDNTRFTGSGGFVAGFLTDVLNPKIGVLFIGFLPGFVPDGYPVTTTTLALGAIYLALTAVYFALLVAAAGKIQTWMQTPRIRRRLDAIAGVTLIGFGIRLATEA